MNTSESTNMDPKKAVQISEYTQIYKNKFVDSDKFVASERFKKGFTLLETLIYIAITSMILTLSFLVVYQLIDSTDRVILSDQLTENQRFLLQKIAWVLQGADVINSPAAGSGGSSLSINKLNYAYNPLVISLSGGVVRLASGATTTPITNSYVTVNSLNFTHRVLSGQTIIEIDAVLANKVGTSTIDTSIIIR